MRIIYMGTPEFAVPPLEALINAGHQVALVVTQPDKAKDRKGNDLYSPVKKRALDYGITVIQPDRVKDNPDLMGIIKAINPDCIVVAAYGRILPKAILDMPRYGCINIHASLLPKYRGAAPIQRSIINGDEFTGISIMNMDAGMDTGDVLADVATVTHGKTAEALHRELSLLGAELLISTLAEIENGKAVRKKQNEAEASYAPMIQKKDGLVDFNECPAVIERLVRGLYPWPSAYTTFEGEMVKIVEVEDLNQLNPAKAGTISRITERGLEVSAGGGTLLIKKVQFPGKKPMLVTDYLRGNRISEGALLGPHTI